MSDHQDFFADWLTLDPAALPDPRLGPFLTTNNPTSRNVHGQPSHVWLVDRFHASSGLGGPVTAFDRVAFGVQLYNCKLYKIVFASQLQTARNTKLNGCTALTIARDALSDISRLVTRRIGDVEKIASDALAAIDTTTDTTQAVDSRTALDKTEALGRCDALPSATQSGTR
jgi:hypothetical protein